MLDGLENILTLGTGGETDSTIQSNLFEPRLLGQYTKEECNKMKPEKDQRRFVCANCNTEIQFGKDIWTNERGVIGPRGIVPLGNVKVFCGEKCISEFFNGEPASDLPEVRFRVP